MIITFSVCKFYEVRDILSWSINCFVNPVSYLPCALDIFHTDKFVTLILIYLPFVVIKRKNVIQLDVDTESNYTVGPLYVPPMNSKQILYMGGIPGTLHELCCKWNNYSSNYVQQ